MANKCLFADLIFFTSGEGNEATSPSFSAKYAAIAAPSSSLEALIATWYMRRGCEGGILPMANKYLFPDL